MEVMARMWFEDLEAFSDELFVRCIKLHRQRSRWFPTPAELIDISQEIFRATPQLQEPTGERYEPTPEEYEEFRRKIKLIGAAVVGRRQRPWTKEDDIETAQLYENAPGPSGSEPTVTDPVQGPVAESTATGSADAQAGADQRPGDPGQPGGVSQRERPGPGL